MEPIEKCTRCGKLTQTKSMVWINNLLQCVRCTIGKNRKGR